MYGADPMEWAAVVAVSVRVSAVRVPSGAVTPLRAVVTLAKVPRA